MRPVIKSALRCLLRDDATVQIGVEAPRATVLTGAGATHVIGSLDGTRDRSEVLAAARSAGVDPATAEKVLDLLADRGVLDDAASDTWPLRDLPLAERDRLGPDLATASLVSRETDAGLSALQRRRRASVHVYGAGRVGGTVASLFAAAGVGCVHPIDPTPARYADAAPAGLARCDVGTARDRAAAAALGRAAPSTRTDDPGRPDFAIVAPVDGEDLALPDTLLQQGVPHLLAAVREACGVVGPFVFPGETACLRCRHLNRTDRDPAWPRLAAQLATSDGGAGSCAVVLATAVAAQTVSQALACVDAGFCGVSGHETSGRDLPGHDGEPPPLATVDGSLELALPDWQWRRRPWPPHPRCGCRWFD